MPVVRRKHNPDTIHDHAEGPTLSAAIKTIRLCLQELYGLVSSSSTSTTIVGGVPAASLETSVLVQWHANGPYRVDTAVDGDWIVTKACSIRQVYLSRRTAGSSGQTVVDINRRRTGDAVGTETTLYTTAANRPTLLFGDADGLTHAVLPDLVDLVVGDIVTIDCDEKDAGKPLHFTLTLEAA